MDDIEALIHNRQPNLSVDEVERIILQASQDPYSLRAFTTREGGIGEVSKQSKAFALLSQVQKEDLYSQALQSLEQKETRYSGQQPTSKFLRLALSGIGIASKGLEVLQNPSKFVSVAQEFLPHPNAPTDSGSTNALKTQP